MITITTNKNNRRFDIRKGDTDEPDMVFTGHNDTITGLALSPDNNHLLSNSMESQLRVWDVRPFVTQNRCESSVFGVHHGAEKLLLKCNWSPDQEMFSAGSADR